MRSDGEDGRGGQWSRGRGSGTLCTLYLCSLAKGHFGCHSSGNWFTTIITTSVHTRLNNSKRIEKQQQWLSFTCQQHLLLLLLRYDTTTTILLFSHFLSGVSVLLCSTTLNESCYRTCSTERQKEREVLGKAKQTQRKTDRLLSFSLIWFHTHVLTTLLYFLSRFLLYNWNSHTSVILWRGYLTKHVISSWRIISQQKYWKEKEKEKSGWCPLGKGVVLVVI